MAKLAIDRTSIVFGKKKSGDFHSKSGDREIFIILSKIGRSPEKSGDLEALYVPIFCILLCYFKPCHDPAYIIKRYIISTRQVTRATHVRNRICPRVKLIIKIIIILLIIFLGFIKSKSC